jgi:hypothetical protein
MTRSRTSAKQAGTRTEQEVATWLATRLNDDRIERRTRNGSKDRGDITGVRTALGDRLVIEVKNVTRLDLAGWVAEAEVERRNDDAAAGVVVHKRRGYGPSRMGGTYVTMTLEDLAVLLVGTP